MQKNGQQMNFFDLDPNTESIPFSIRQVSLDPPLYWAEAVGWLGVGGTREKAVGSLQRAILKNLGIAFQIPKGL